MVTISYCLYVDLMSLFFIVFLLIGMLLDGLVTSESFGSATCFQEASQLVHPSRILPPYQRLVVFYHVDWFVFMGILFYYDYHVIPHPPMKFQDDTLCFGWVLEVVTL